MVAELPTSLVLAETAVKNRRGVILLLKSKFKEVDPHVVEDAVDEAIIILSQKSDPIKDIKQLKAWLLTTAKHRLQHELDKTKWLDRLENMRMEPSSTDGEVESFEINNAIEIILKKLSNERYRNVFQLILEGYKPREIAKKMELSEEAAYKLTERAREHVKEIYQELFGNYPPPPQ